VELQVRLVAQIAVVLFVGVALDDDGRIVLRLDRSTRCGSVLIDGRDVRGITGPSLRKQLACVTQENFLFAGRVLDNLRVGRPGASEDEVRAAARAGYARRAGNIPAGLATDVGEGRARLSLGQRQVAVLHAPCSPTRAFGDRPPRQHHPPRRQDRDARPWTNRRTAVTLRARAGVEGDVNSRAATTVSDKSLFTVVNRC
jgi:hypothetical protein